MRESAEEAVMDLKLKILTRAQEAAAIEVLSDRGPLQVALVQVAISPGPLKSVLEALERLHGSVLDAGMTDERIVMLHHHPVGGDVFALLSIGVNNGVAES